VGAGTMVFGAVMNGNLTVNISTYDETNNIVQGTFSGIVKNASDNDVTIANGTFKAELQ
jgi:hypothetical protein